MTYIFIHTSIQYVSYISCSPDPTTNSEKYVLIFPRNFCPIWTGLNKFFKSCLSIVLFYSSKTIWIIFGSLIFFRKKKQSWHSAISIYLILVTYIRIDLYSDSKWFLGGYLRKCGNLFGVIELVNFTRYLSNFFPFYGRHVNTLFFVFPF